MRDITNHQRVNDILLGPLERPALKWLAGHLPAWVSPDICTAFGVMGAVVIMVSYGLSRFNNNFLWLASFGFIVNWFGDSLDGTIARFLHIERTIYGFYIDHITDAVSQVMIFLGLGFTHYVSFEIACLILISYLLLSVLVYVRTCVIGEFRISYGKLGPTEIRLLAILLNAVMYFAGKRSIILMTGSACPVSISIYDIFVGAIAVLLLGFFILTATQETIRLMKADKLRHF